jgi:hypothetical protein
MGSSVKSMASVRLVSCVGQIGGYNDRTETSQKSLMTPLGPEIKTTSETRAKEKQEAPQIEVNQNNSWQELIQGTSPRLPTKPAIHPSQKPTRVGTGQTGHAWTARDELHPWVNSKNNQASRSPVRSMVSRETLGKDGTPHG